MDRIIAGTPIKAPKDKSTWIIGDTYTYKNHPYHGICGLNNKGNPVMRCSECKNNITDNWCKCSPQQYLIHKDRQIIGKALRGILRGTKFKKSFIERFKKEKGCTPDEFGIHLKLVKIGWGKGKSECDHRISPIGFDLTNPREKEFICHYKNNELVPSKQNKQKYSHNDPAEVKIIYEELAKETPPGDIHDILNARRKKCGVKEVHHIVEDAIPDMNRSEEPSVWNEDEYDDDEEEAEYEAKIAKANAKREAKIAKANKKIAKANAKHEAEIAKAKAEREDKIQKEILKRESEILKHQSEISKRQSEILKHQSEILKDQSEIAKCQSEIDALRKKQQNI